MSDEKISAWPHRIAWVLCVATFPLLWIGGLITTTDAGMAVPDWPNTYGYNMFLYPWETWFYGPWDLFIEHGHRLFASGVGLITIGLLVAVWRSEPHHPLRNLALIALLLVIFQGALGGMRVVLNERLLALLHGCTGPLFFALTSALVVLTARTSETKYERLRIRNFWLPVLIYFQLTIGASLRHVPETEHFGTFATHVQAHLWMALLVLVGSMWVALRTSNSSWGVKIIRGALGLVVCSQICLGIASWCMKYRLPDWATRWWPGTLIDSAMSTATVADGWLETHLVTAHSATGSLLIALTTALAVLSATPITELQES